jgi:hypothetical protein
VRSATSRTKPAAMVRVSDHLKSRSADETLTPAAMRGLSRVAAVSLPLVSPSECTLFARSAGHFCPAMWTEAECSARFPSRLASATPPMIRRSFGPAPSGSGLPGDLAITPHVVAFAALLPSTLAPGPRVGRKLPLRTVRSRLKTSPAPAGPVLFVPVLFAPTRPAIWTAFIFASTITVFAHRFAIGTVEIVPDSATGPFGHSVVGAVVPDVRIVVWRVGHLVRSHFARGVGSPISLGRKLDERRRRDSSKKHERIIPHRHFLATSNAVQFPRVDAVTDSRKPTPHSRPMDVSRPRLRVTIRPPTLTEDEVAQRL